VDLEDVVQSAGKLEMTEEAIREILRTAEWARTEG
jgi:hypothetical protein